MLGKFSAKETSFKANLKDGRTVNLFLRPYCLADMAWMQDNFSSEEDTKAIQRLDIDISCKCIWHQLKAESKQIFLDFKYTKEDENTVEVEYSPEGYERFLEGILDFNSFIVAYAAYADSMQKNGFIPDTSKKKILKK